MTFTLRQCLSAEVLGTAFLLIFGTGAVVVEAGPPPEHGGHAAVFGLIIIQCLGHVSETHANPAVTVGFWAAGRFLGCRVLPYVLAQLMGAPLPGHGLDQVFGVELGLACWLILLMPRVTSSY